MVNRIDPRDESGQGVIEYVLLVAIVVGGALTLMNGLGRIGVMGKLTAPLKSSFAATYQFGHPKAKDGDTTENHPRHVPDRGQGNFRIFINPKPK